MGSLRCRWLFVALLAGSGPSAQELEKQESDELRALVQVSAEPGAPGGLLAVLRRGEPCFVHAFGLADLAGRTPVTRATVFYLASVAKVFTAAAVQHAAEAGKLSLDEAITTHVRGLPASHAGVTLRHLLDHRGGLKDIYDLAIGLDLGRAVLASNEAALATLAHLDLDFAPGSRFRYSNSGYVLLAEALRGATGSSLAAYLRANLFAPLGMKSAHAQGEAGFEALPHARGYHRAGPAWEALENPSGLIGPGGLWASLDDLALWERAAFEGGWGNEALRRRLTTPPALGERATLHPSFGPYTSGVMVGGDRGLRVVRAAGEAFGFSAEVLRYPDQELSVVVLTNADLDLDSLAEDAAAVVLREEFRAARPASASALARPAAVDLARFGRMWREEGTGILWVLTLRPERMRAASLGDWKLEVVPDGPTRLVSVGTRAPVELSFEPATGPAQRMLVEVGGVELASCKPLPPPAGAAPDLVEYEGAYVLPSIGAEIAVRASGAGLTLVQQRPLFPFPPFTLPLFHALGADLFVCDAGAQMQFLRDDSGEITGLHLDLNRASGLVLQRR